MLKTSIVLLGLAICLTSCSSFELVKGNYQVLNGGPTPQMLRPCSRPGPPPFEGTWDPSQDVIYTLEDRIHKIHRLRATQCCLIGERIDNVNKYFRYYVGIVVEGRRLVYITTGDESDVCDGGTCCWSAVYDPESGRFFDLQFNGVA